MKLRTIGKLLGGLLAFVILALISLPFLISAETLKAKAVAELSKATGRSITIEGPASLKLFPTIAIALEKVTLGNPQGDFASARMFYAEKVATGVELMPLLDKQVVITGVTLEGADITLEETKSGIKNWDFARSGKAVADTAPDAAAKPKAAKPFSIGDIAVKDSAVTYRPAKGEAMALQHINLTLSGVDGSAPLALDAEAEYKGGQVSLSLDAKDARALLEGKGSTPLLVELALPGGTLHFDGTAEKAGDFAAAGKLKLDMASLPSTLKWATGKAASATLPKSVTLQSHVKARGKTIALSDLQAKADDVSLAGQVNADLTGAVPSLTGTLRLSAIDTARFAGARGDAKTTAAQAAGTAPAAGSGGWSSAPIDLSGLKAVNAKLGVTLDGVKVGALTLGQGVMDVGLQNGTLALGIERWAVYEGNARGALQVSPAGLSTDLTISDVRIEPLLTALSGDSRLSGTGALVLKLRASGNSQKAWVSSLGGTAQASLKDGKLKGLNLTEFLRNVKQGKFYADDSQATDFASFSGSWNFANGVGSNTDLALNAPAIRMTGSGSVNLPSRSLNYKLMPTLVASSKGQGATKEKPGFTVPLLVSGPWSNLQIVPDIAGMIQEGLRDPEALKQNLKGLKDTLKDFNSPSDIGKALLGGGAAKEAAPAETAPAESTSAPVVESAPAQGKADPKAQAIEQLFKSLSK